MNRQMLSENDYQTLPIERPSALFQCAENILCFFDCVIAFFSEKAVLATIRTMLSVLCFFAFIFVIGAVEAEALTLGGGFLLSLFLFGIAFLSVYGSRTKKDA